MKRIIYIITLTLCLSFVHQSANAVTDKEMEQARTIATKAYLRYANDGSGYLDDLQVKTMAELEKNLKPKEKENIKAFKAIPVPGDYKTWDKQKLVEYWGSKAFSTPGLLEKGRIGRARAKKNINAMTIAAPAKETEPSKKEAPATSPEPTQPTASPQEDATSAAAAPAATTAAADSTATAAIEQAEATAEALSQLDEEPQLPKANNHTWVYILILCILVAVVCALVVFASNVMKKNQQEPLRGDIGKTDKTDSANANALREKFAATLNAKNEEIRILSKKNETLNAQNASLKGNLESLTAEIASLRTRLSDANKAAAASPASPKPAEQNARQVAASPESAPQQKSTPLRTIYLGRANAKGIFVRADRSLNLGNSIYRLDTTDGYAGSFRIANHPGVWEMALQAPSEALSGACVISNPDSTEGMTKVVNDSAGTAIFEGGCWKVIRKAKAHYE